jgi:biotin carboxylase
VRILIGNHIDPAIRDRGDLRAWTQRIVWFARDGDVVVLSDEPDRRFLAYATSYTGVDPASLRFLVPPAGRHDGRLLDPESLNSAEFLRVARAELGVAGVDQVEEVFALWPSAHVSRFAAALGVEDRFPGADFFAQGGGELGNNKATFRALAAGADVPIPAGAVCRSPSEAVAATADLLSRTGGVVVKQAHNGAGVGNQLVLRNALLAAGHIGARHLHQLDEAPEAIETYWAQRWDWATAQGRFPVVVEEFTPHTASVYSEHYADNGGTRPTEMGTLHYVGRRLSYQIAPLRGVGENVREQLLNGGTRLAETYRAFGYRGHLSADAVVTEDGRVVFTEVNAQVSGSLHIYQVIAHQVVDVKAVPERSVVEYHVPPTWAVPDFDTFLAAVHELGCAYDWKTRTGVIVSMPAIPLEVNRAQFVFCIAYATDADRQAMFERLDARFAVVPASSFGASDHIGVPRPSAS